MAKGRNIMVKPAVAPSWEVTPEKVEKAVQRIVETSRPAKIILFGSYVKGTIGSNSDLDILVIASGNIADSRRESVRIRRALRGISMPMDILVVSQPQWEQLKDAPGLIYREAATNGKVVYER
ncbi:MAG: nucleotidyltransferase domain-containing protein [Nitrospinae bacterium]|nr:nucleotidyltransferase domain-containing protein [Nitrospinota bacterium]